MDLSAIDLNLLRAFHVLLEERHVTRAAAKLGISQPGMSNALSRLRDLLDDDVLVRTSDGMQPTPRALSIAAPITAALQQIEEALLPESFDPESSTRKFHIMSSYYGFSILPKLLKEARTRAPNAEFVVRYADLAVEFEPGLSDIIIGFSAEPPSNCESAKLFEEQLVCLCSRDGCHGDELTLEDYKNASHAIVTSDSFLVEKLAELFGDEGFSRSVSAEISHPVGLTQIIAETDMIATVPRRAAKNLESDKRLRVVDAPFDLSVDVCLFWHDRLDSDAGNRWLRERVIESAR